MRSKSAMRSASPSLSPSPSPPPPSVDFVSVRPTNSTLGAAWPGARPGAGDQVGRGAARRTLLDQIARLERELVEQRCSNWPRPDPELTLAHKRGARLLGIGELETLRDELVATLWAERKALARRTLAEERSRRLREELMLDPAANAGARVRNADVGEGGCGEVRSEPVGGLLGMLMGWWRVVVSSGCP